MTPGSSPDPAAPAGAPVTRSIGDVLTLLRSDFPDVTISKIRYLESQGLVHPARTASGYRQFDDDDVERLRWVLRQQRDHFLPLRVIREKLARGDLDEGNGAAIGPAPTIDVDGPATGRRYDRAELALRSGLSERAVAELESFGLNTREKVGGEVLKNGGDATVAGKSWYWAGTIVYGGGWKIVVLGRYNYTRT